MVLMILAIISCGALLFGVGMFALIKVITMDTEWTSVQTDLHLDDKYFYLYDEVKRGK